MGKVIVKLKIINTFDTTYQMEIEAVIDTGATMLVLPADVIQQLHLREMRRVRVKYANGTIDDSRPVYGVVTVEIQKRAGEFNVLEEAVGTQALVGQIVLEQLDLIVDCGAGKVFPNPDSPEIPLLEIL